MKRITRVIDWFKPKPKPKLKEFGTMVKNFQVIGTGWTAALEELNSQFIHFGILRRDIIGIEHETKEDGSKLITCWYYKFWEEYE